jgi:hypothetical protein
MARITCRTPSTGRPIRASLVNVTTDFVTIAEALDFSVPDTSRRFGVRDPLDDNRAVRPGELFFLTPLAAVNKTSTTRWIEVRLVTEDGEIIAVGRAEVPGNDTAYIPLQGRSLFKRNPNASNGDRIQVRSENSNVFDVWASAEEKLSNEHSGVE